MPNTLIQRIIPCLLTICLFSPIAYTETLAESGVSGTPKNRFQNTPLLTASMLEDQILSLMNEA